MKCMQQSSDLKEEKKKKKQKYENVCALEAFKLIKFFQNLVFFSQLVRYLLD